MIKSVCNPNKLVLNEKKSNTSFFNTIHINNCVIKPNHNLTKKFVR